MTIRNENGERFISLKWFAGIMVTILLSVMGAWASQRHSFESGILERISILEQRQSAVITRLDANHQVLQEIRQDLRDHRVTGK